MQRKSTTLGKTHSVEGWFRDAAILPSKPLGLDLEWEPDWFEPYVALAATETVLDFDVKPSRRRSILLAAVLPGKLQVFPGLLSQKIGVEVDYVGVLVAKAAGLISARFVAESHGASAEVAPRLFDSQPAVVSV